MVFHRWVLRLAAVSLALSPQASTGGSYAGTSANIAPNPSAEQVDKRNRLIGWGHYTNTPNEWGPSSDEFYAGARCAFLKITGFADDACACTSVMWKNVQHSSSMMFTLGSCASATDAISGSDGL